MKDNQRPFKYVPVNYEKRIMAFPEAVRTWELNWPASWDAAAPLTLRLTGTFHKCVA
jgi:hypothetical protein